MFYLRPEEFWQELPSDISNLYSFNTVLHQRTSQQRRTFDKSEVLLPLPSNAASFLRWRLSPFKDESSHLLRDCTKFPHYYILHHVTKAWFTLCHSPLSETEDKFCNSFIQQQCTLQQNFHLDVELHVPQMFYQLPYIPNSEKYNKCKVCQVTLPMVGGVGATLHQSDISLLSNAVAMVTSTWHTDIPLTNSTAILTYKCIFNPLHRSPAQTNVL